MVISDTSLRPFLTTALEQTDFKGLGTRYVGKVRDVYSQEDRSILIATDRQSAFDISWCSVPLKGQTLNQLSAWWFTQVGDVMPHHVIAVPDENAMVVRRLAMVKVEIVVRAYLAGSTGTSAWMNYAKGVRRFCGHELPDGLRKNQAIPQGPILTPTTKGEHDEPIDAAEVIRRGLTTAKQWEEIEASAHALFRRGQEIARRRGLILVDTKYEMGYDDAGRLTLADEVHTPDSSRYWVASSYERLMNEGKEPESLDKEFFRLWLREQGFEYGGRKPAITDDVRLMLGQKYITLYEQMTGESFIPPRDPEVLRRIERNLTAYRNS